MEEKSGDIVHKSCKFNQQLILLWVEENKAVFVAILFLMLCFGIMDTVVFVINNTFLHVTAVGRNVWLDWLFIIITSLLGYGVWKSWIKVEKRIAPKTIALILVPTVLFVFFRFKKNSLYNFTSYWNGPISYLDGIALISFVIIGVFIYQQMSEIVKARFSKAGAEEFSNMLYKLASKHGYLNEDTSRAIDDIVAAVIEREKGVTAVNIPSVNQVNINPKQVTNTYIDDKKE